MSYKYAGYYLESLTDDYGNVLLPPSTVSVYLTGTQTLATLYTDQTKVTTTTNPFTVPTSGNVVIWADPGFYDLVPTFEGVTLPVVTVLVPLNPLELGGTPDQLAVFNSPGGLAVTNGQGSFVFPYSGNLVSVTARATTAPQGAPILLDVLKNGTTLWPTNPNNKPSIPIGANLSGTAVPDTTTFSTNDFLSVNITQVGSTVPGADLTVTVRYN